MKNSELIARGGILIGLLCLIYGFSVSDKPSYSISLDPDPPVAVCHDTVQVFIDNDALTVVDATVFDDGSTDNCPPLTFAVRRTDLNCDGSLDDYEPFVEFCCEDIGTTDMAVSLLVVDGVGNFSACTSVVEVVDALPVANCVTGYVVEIPPTGLYSLLAEELNEGSYNSCGSGELSFSFSSDPSDTVYVVTCDDICDPQQDFEIWVTDEGGSQSTCETFIIIQDNLNVCGECFPVIAGLIITEEDEGIGGVQVTLNDGLFESETEADGFYVFEPIPSDDYWIYPEKDYNYGNGVSTFDMVLIQLHILAVQPLDSPYKRIAADVNASGSISTLDLLSIQQLILGNSMGYPNNTSWRFIDAAYEFPDPNNPWLESFPETIVVNSSDLDVIDADFIGMKIGDVNNSAIPDE